MNKEKLKNFDLLLKNIIIEVEMINSAAIKNVRYDEYEDRKKLEEQRDNALEELELTKEAIEDYVEALQMLGKERDELASEIEKMKDAMNCSREISINERIVELITERDNALKVAAEFRQLCHELEDKPKAATERAEKAEAELADKQMICEWLYDEKKRLNEINDGLFQNYITYKKKATALEKAILQECPLYTPCRLCRKFNEIGQENCMKLCKPSWKDFVFDIARFATKKEGDSE